MGGFWGVWDGQIWVVRKFGGLFFLGPTTQEKRGLGPAYALQWYPRRFLLRFPSWQWGSGFPFVFLIWIPFTPFLGGSTKKDSKKLVPTYSNLSTGGPRRGGDGPSPLIRPAHDLPGGSEAVAGPAGRGDGGWAGGWGGGVGGRGRGEG